MLVTMDTQQNNFLRLIRDQSKSRSRRFFLFYSVHHFEWKELRTHLCFIWLPVLPPIRQAIQPPRQAGSACTIDWICHRCFTAANAAAGAKKCHNIVSSAKCVIVLLGHHQHQHHHHQHCHCHCLSACKFVSVSSVCVYVCPLCLSPALVRVP